MRRAALLTAALLAVLGVAPASSPAAQWLAGDLHVHSCDSDDAYCGTADEPLAYEPGDDPRNLEGAFGQLTTIGVQSGDRFVEASTRGLNFLAITDHNSVVSQTRPGFGGSGVIGIPGYENSLKGHAQMLGATRVYPNGDAGPAATKAVAAALRADGGAFQINHPQYRSDERLERCDDAPKLNWRLGLELAPDTVEVLNPTAEVAVAERFAECLLGRGARFGLTGGSDSHFAALTPAQGVGNPTTWVLAGERSRAGVLAALRSGRTAISRRPPMQGGGPLVLEADPEGDGSFTNAVGEDVPAGAAMRVRALGAADAGFVDVRANGKPLMTGTPLGPGGAAGFRAPASGWVRATLFSQRGIDLERAPSCQQFGQPASICPYDQAVVGMSSPAYVGEARGAAGGARPAAGALSARADTRLRPLLRTLLRRRGVRVGVSCSLACSARVELRVASRRGIVGRRTFAVPAGSRRTALVALPAAVRRGLRSGSALTVRAVVRGPDGQTRVLTQRARARRG